MHPLRSQSQRHLLRDAILGAGFFLCASGCSLCPSPYDYDYGGFVSKTPRSDMRHGRVGSIFSDPAIVGETVSEVIETSDGSIELGVEAIDGIEIQDPVGSGLPDTLDN